MISFSIGRLFFRAIPVPVRFPDPFILPKTVAVYFTGPFIFISSRSSLKYGNQQSTSGNKREQSGFKEGQRYNITMNGQGTGYTTVCAGFLVKNDQDLG